MSDVDGCGMSTAVLCLVQRAKSRYFRSGHLCFPTHKPQTCCNYIVYVCNVRFDPLYLRSIIYFHFDLVRDTNLASVPVQRVKSR